MAQAAFDSLAYARKLENVGFTREQAETQATAMRQIVEERAASREYPDMRLHELELKLKYDLTLRLGGIVVACTAILLAALPLIIE